MLGLSTMFHQSPREEQPTDAKRIKLLVLWIRNLLGASTKVTNMEIMRSCFALLVESTEERVVSPLGDGATFWLGALRWDLRARFSSLLFVKRFGGC